MRMVKKFVVGISNQLIRLTMKQRGQRVVILHNHLFKNAGSTIDWALQQNFDDAFVDHRDNEQMKKGAAYLGPYLIDNRQIIALSTHHLTLPLPEMPKLRLMQIIMFRHPLERVTSVYNFERAQESDTHPGVIHAQKFSLRDYIYWRMRPEVGSTIRNFQVRKLLPPRKIGQEKISENEMDNLKRQLKRIELLGLVGRFDESMVLFEESLGRAFPLIDLSYIAQNVGQEASLKQEARLERLRAEIGNETYDLLAENNQQDLQLLSFAEEEFEFRISKVSNFVAKLKNFRARCAAKSSMASKRG